MHVLKKNLKTQDGTIWRAYFFLKNIRLYFLGSVSSRQDLL